MIGPKSQYRQYRTLDGTPLKTRRLYIQAREMFRSRARGEHTPGQQTHAATITGDYIVRGSICIVHPLQYYTHTT
jgi:hypothetical protein